MGRRMTRRHSLKTLLGQTVATVADLPCQSASVVSPPLGGTTVALGQGVEQRAIPTVALHERLARLARLVDTLVPSHRDPEQFHVLKSEIAAELRRLARGMA